MKFCSNLTHDINFETDAIQPCCNTRELGALPRFPFLGGDVNMAAYTQHIVNTIEAIQKPDGLCAGCPSLRECAPGTLNSGNFPIVFKTVSINKHRNLCNCKCVYCNFWKEKQSDSYAVLPVIKSLHKQHALEKECRFSWGGGEPTILKEFDEASRWIAQHGYKQHVCSNALRFAPSIANLLEQGAMELIVSLDAGSPETYKSIKGVDKFDAVTTHLRMYADKAKDKKAIHVKYILFPMNNSQREIENFFSLCTAIGIKDVQLSFDFREVNANTISEQTLNSALLFIKSAIDHGISYSTFYVDEHFIRKIFDTIP